VNLVPRAPRGWYAPGHAYEGLGLPHQALEALGRARGLGQDDAPLFLSLARVQRALRHAGLAARDYEVAPAPLQGPSTEVPGEAAVLATEDSARRASSPARSAGSAARSSDDAWLRALVRELPGGPKENVGATFRALEVRRELATLSHGLLTALRSAI
jgi:hypothetical protein